MSAINIPATMLDGRETRQSIGEERRNVCSIFETKTTKGFSRFAIIALLFIVVHMLKFSMRLHDIRGLPRLTI